jgi:D-alanyl-D-alanine carboxypeptidase (penicillin-binding protein 5/6)
LGDDTEENEVIDMEAFNQPLSADIKIVAPKLLCRYAIAMDTVTGRVLLEKNAYLQTPMASTTKIMTAILALEKGNLDDVVTVSARAARVGGSCIHLQKGEKIKLGDLLYGLMIPSGNDAAIAIAEHIGGTVENFATMMTEKAHQIGAYNTAFITPHGLDKDGHYTTAYELALITRYALRNKKFSEIVGTYQTIISGAGNSTRHLTNTNEMLAGYEGADGVKTGFTGKAGRCLVSSATKKNWRIISVVLGSNTRYERAADSTKILNYTFNNYQLMDLNKSIKIETTLKIKKGREDILKLTNNEPMIFPLRQDEISQLTLSYDLPSLVTAPLKKGTKLGTATYSIGNYNCMSIDLFAPRDVNKKNVLDYCDFIYNQWIDSFRYCSSWWFSF